MYAHAHAQPRLSRAAMVAALPAPPVSAKLVARNTLDYGIAGGVRRIRLHATDILEFKPDGSFSIDTGGWNTHTTRARLNACLPAGYRVGTGRGVAYLCAPSGSVAFVRRVRVAADGTVKPDAPPDRVESLVRSIDRYMAAFRKNGLPTAENFGGDPWIFQDPGTKVAPDVMRDWLASRYVFRLMYKLALQYAGLTELGVSYRMQCADSRGLDRKDFGRIRRYIRACVGLSA